MAKQNGNGNGDGDGWTKAAKAAGKVILGGVGGPVLEGAKALYKYVNTSEKKEAAKPVKGGASKTAPLATKSSNPKEKIYDLGVLPEHLVDHKKGKQGAKRQQLAQPKGQQGAVKKKMDIKKAQPIKTSEPRSSIEKLPEAPTPKHKLSPKEVVTNMKLGVNHMRQLNEKSREE